MPDKILHGVAQRGEIPFRGLHPCATGISARWALRLSFSADPGLRRLCRLRPGLSNLAPLGLPRREPEQKYAEPPGAVFLNRLGHRSRCLKNPRGEAAYLLRRCGNVRTSRMNLNFRTDDGVGKTMLILMVLKFLEVLQTWNGPYLIRVTMPEKTACRL